MAPKTPSCLSDEELSHKIAEFRRDIEHAEKLLDMNRLALDMLLDESWKRARVAQLRVYSPHPNVQSLPRDGSIVAVVGTEIRIGEQDAD